MGTLLSFVQSKSAIYHSTQPTHQCIHWVLCLKLFQFTAGLCLGDAMGRVPHLLPPLLLHAVYQSLWVQVKCRLQPYVVLSWWVLPTVWNLKVKEVAAVSVETLITVQIGVCLSESETYWSLWVTTAVQNRGRTVSKSQTYLQGQPLLCRKVHTCWKHTSLGDCCCAEGCVSISNISPCVTSPQGYQYISPKSRVSSDAIYTKVTLQVQCCLWFHFKATNSKETKLMISTHYVPWACEWTDPWFLHLWLQPQWMCPHLQTLSRPPNQSPLDAHRL